MQFMVSTKDHDFFWDAAGFYKYNITHINNFKYYYNSQQPDWLESAVIYHIFIDRFYKSTTASHQNAKWEAAPKNITEQPPDVVSGVDAEYITAIGKLEDRLLILLDLTKILSNEEKKVLE